MSLKDWPAGDRASWIEATSLEDLSGHRGLAGRWAPGTKKTIERSWGTYLFHLRSKGRLAPARRTGERTSVKKLFDFRRDLRRQKLSQTSMKLHYRHIRSFLTVTDPVFLDNDEAAPLLDDWRRTYRRPKPPRLRPKAQFPASDELFRGLIQHLQELDSKEPGHPWPDAIEYRDAVMTLFLTLRPIRRKNAMAIRIGSELRWTEDHFELSFARGQTKNQYNYAAALSAEINPFLWRWCFHHRLILLQDRQSDALWISRFGRPISRNQFTEAVSNKSKKLFGTAMSPHKFRHAAMSTLAEKLPASMAIAPMVLGNRDRNVIDDWYANPAPEAAQRYYHALLDRLKA